MSINFVALSLTDRFAFGLRAVENPGRDSCGEPTRPHWPALELCQILGKAGGVYEVNFHSTRTAKSKKC